MTRIPDNKRYFRIGEASRIIGVEPYVLRFWETEFPQVRPDRDPGRQRLYTRQDLELFFRIKKLLYEDQYTIAGAKKQLRAAKKTTQVQGLEGGVSALREIKNSLLEIKRLLSRR